MPTEESPTVRATNRRYLRRLLAALAAYSAVLVVTLTVLGSESVGAPLSYGIALLPLLPAVGVPAAVVGLLRDSDEMQRRINLEALAIAFGLGSFLTFGYGFLQIAGAPDVSWLMVWPVYAVAWLISSTIVGRRYRAGC